MRGRGRWPLVLTGLLATMATAPATAQSDGREFVGEFDNTGFDISSARLVENRIRLVVTTTGIQTELSILVDGTIDFTPIGEPQNPMPTCIGFRQEAGGPRLIFDATASGPQTTSGEVTLATSFQDSACGGGGATRSGTSVATLTVTIDGNSAAGALDADGNVILFTAALVGTSGGSGGSGGGSSGGGESSGGDGSDSIDDIDTIGGLLGFEGELSEDVTDRLSRLEGCFEFRTGDFSDASQTPNIERQVQRCQANLAPVTELEREFAGRFASNDGFVMARSIVYYANLTDDQGRAVLPSVGHLYPVLINLAVRVAEGDTTASDTLRRLIPLLVQSDLAARG